MDVDAATQTMIDNLPARTGRELPEWFAELDAAGIDRHAAAVAFLKTEHGLTHGFANLIVKLHRSQGEDVSAEGLVGAQYEGSKAALRPIYERIIAAASALGDDVEISPKKTAVSLRRGKQFALVEAPSAARVRVGINLPGVSPTERLRSATGMCTHRVDVASVDDVDAELVGWLREAYDRA